MSFVENHTQPNIGSNVSFTFFGSSDFSVHILNELEKLGLRPKLVVSTPDKPRGRKMIVTPTVVSAWALERGIPVHRPETLKTPEGVAAITELTQIHAIDVFVVASYGKIIPQNILDIPRAHVLNIHPSLLPKYRGASPIQSAMLADDTHTGVSIIKLDAEMDHGPLIGPQKEVHFAEWPPYAETEKMLAENGAQLLAQCIGGWVNRTIIEKSQQHDLATYTKKIEKEDGLIPFEDIINIDTLPRDAQRNIFLKVQAFSVWPSVYFFTPQGERIKIIRASWNSDSCSIETVIPEGKKEVSWSDYRKNI